MKILQLKNAECLSMKEVTMLVELEKKCMKRSEQETIKRLKQDRKVFSPDIDDDFYFIGDGGGVYHTEDEHVDVDKKALMIDAGNACIDFDVFCKKENDMYLHSALWNFAYENNFKYTIDMPRKSGKGFRRLIAFPNEYDLYKGGKRKYFIYYDEIRSEWKVYYKCHHHEPTAIYFSSESVAQRAIDEIVKPYFEDDVEND